MRSMFPECPPLERLLEFVQGELDAPAAEFETHLAECERCLAELDRWHRQPDGWTETLRAAEAEASTAADDEGLLDALLTDLKQLLTERTHSATSPAEVDDELRLLAAQGVLRNDNGTEPIGRLGEYCLLRLIGKGGMGLVFEAEDVRLRRRVALKVVRPALAIRQSARQRFLREAQVIAALDHEHVVPVYQAGEENGVAYFAMPLLEGESLENRLRRDSRLTPAEVCSLGRQIAAGLAAAHSQGLVHRDLKPANIWLSPCVKLLDFGLARLVDSDEGLTASGVIPGTPGYLAPELLRGEAATPQSDLFAVGCILYRALTGNQPFPTNVFAALKAVENGALATPSELAAGIPAELSGLVMRLLDKSPTGRPASTAELYESLERVSERMERGDAVAEISTDTHWQTGRWTRGLVSLLLLLFLAAGGGGVLWTVRGHRFSPDRGDPLAHVPRDEPEPFALLEPDVLAHEAAAEIDSAAASPPEAWHLLVDEQFSMPPYQSMTNGNAWGVEQGRYFDELGPGRRNVTSAIGIGPREPAIQDLAVDVRFRCFHTSFTVTLRRSKNGMRRETCFVLEPSGGWTLLRRSFVTRNDGRRQWQHDPLPVEVPGEPLGYRAGQWADLRMEAIGDRVSIHVDGQLAGIVRDPERHAVPAETGRPPVAVGMISRTNDSGARREIDHVRIWIPVGEEG